MHHPPGIICQATAIVPQFRTGDIIYRQKFCHGINGDYVVQQSGQKLLTTELGQGWDVYDGTYTGILPTELNADIIDPSTELDANLDVTSNELVMPHGKYMRSHDTHNDSFIVQ